MTKSYVMTSGGSLHVNTTLTVGSQILDIFPVKMNLINVPFNLWLYKVF